MGSQEGPVPSGRTGGGIGLMAGAGSTAVCQSAGPEWRGTRSTPFCAGRRSRGCSSIVCSSPPSRFVDRRWAPVRRAGGAGSGAPAGGSSEVGPGASTGRAARGSAGCAVEDAGEQHDVPAGPVWASGERPHPGPRAAIQPLARVRWRGRVRTSADDAQGCLHHARPGPRLLRQTHLAACGRGPLGGRVTCRSAARVRPAASRGLLGGRERPVARPTTAGPRPNRSP